MKIENISHSLLTSIIIGALFLVSSFASADDTKDVALEISSTRDSIIVVHTVCAPICSSHARVYNKEWKEISVLKPPFKSAFPEAYIENGKVLWRDNDNFDYTPQ